MYILIVFESDIYGFTKCPSSRREYIQVGLFPQIASKSNPKPVMGRTLSIHIQCGEDTLCSAEALVIISGEGGGSNCNVFSMDGLWEGVGTGSNVLDGDR